MGNGWMLLRLWLRLENHPIGLEEVTKHGN